MIRFLNKIINWIETKNNLNKGYVLLRAVLSFSLLILFLLNFSSMKDIVLTKENPFKLRFLKYDIFSVMGFYFGYFLSITILIANCFSFLPIIFTSLLFYVYSSYIIHFPNMSDGGDYISTIMVFILIPLSLSDFRLFGWRDFNTTKYYNLFQKQAEKINYNAIRLFVSIIYFHAAVSKFHVTEWYNGTAIYYFINDPLSGNVNVLDIPIIKAIISNPYGIVLLSWGALITEVLISFMLFSSNYKTKTIVFVLGALLHILIAPLFFIPMFSFRMIGFLIFYLLIKPIQND